MKYRTIIICFLLLLSMFILAEAYTVRLNQYAYISLGLPGVVVDLEKVPPRGLSLSPILSDTLYGKMNLAGNTIYVVVGKRDGKMVLYVNRDGSGCFTQWDRVNLIEDPQYRCLTSELVSILLKYGNESHDYVVKFLVSTLQGYLRLSVLEAFQRTGYITLDGVRHEVFLSNIRPTGHFDDLKNNAIGIDVGVDMTNGHFYSLRETENEIEIGNERFIVKRISPAGTEIELTSSGTVTSIHSRIGDVLSDLHMEVIDRSTPLKTNEFHLNDLKGDYILLYAWRGAEMGDTEATPTRSTKEINEIYERYRDEGLKVIGVDVSAQFTKPKSDLYHQLRLRFFMDDNGLGFLQLTPKSSREVSKLLHLSYPSEICLISPEGVVLYRTEKVWNAYGQPALKNISITQLKNILESLLSERGK